MRPPNPRGPPPMTARTSAAERAEISRKNGCMSKGPTSSAGKMRSRMNALKHGMTARIPVLPGEDRETFRQHVEGIVDSLSPRDALELALSEQVATSLWKIERGERVEATRGGDHPRGRGEGGGPAAGGAARAGPLAAGQHRQDQTRGRRRCARVPPRGPPRPLPGRPGRAAGDPPPRRGDRRGLPVAAGGAGTGSAAGWSRTGAGTSRR